IRDKLVTGVQTCALPISDDCGVGSLGADKVSFGGGDSGGAGASSSWESSSVSTGSSGGSWLPDMDMDLDLGDDDGWLVILLLAEIGRASCREREYSTEGD